MTTLAVYASIEQSGNSLGIYVISDSRISWNDGTKFDLVKKIYHLNSSPEIFGHLGDVVFGKYF